MIILKTIPLIRRITCIAAVLILAVHASAGKSADSIKILTIGSSFAENATEYLPEIARNRGVTITITKANIGGSDLARHARHLSAWLKNPVDPEAKPYWNRSDPAQTRYSLVEMLRSDDWDYVTLQQFSGDSDKPWTYEPYSAQLIAAVREHAPSARTIVHQTWAYRSDHPLFFPKNPGLQTPHERVVLARSRDKQQRLEPITQRAMYEGLRTAYDQLAERYGLLVIPVADAFQLARTMPEWHFTHPDPDFDYTNPPPGSVPQQNGSLIGGWFWRTDRRTGEVSFALDAKHANVAGKYLGACVFFESLTGQDAREVEWRPDRLTKAEAESLRRVAHMSMVARKETGTFDFAQAGTARR